jgi:hypothetical protein
VFFACSGCQQGQTEAAQDQQKLSVWSESEKKRTDGEEKEARDE